MPNSLHKGFIRTPPQRFEANAPIDASTYRDAIVNNAVHLADMSAQVRVNWTVANDGDPETDDYELAPQSFDDGQHSWSLITMYGPWAHTVGFGGEGFNLRVRVRGYTTSGTASVLLVLCERRSVARFLTNVTPDFTVFAQRGIGLTTTHEWRDGNLAGEYQIHLHPNQYERSRLTVGVAAGSTDTTAIDCAQLVLAVFGSKNTVRLTGVYAAEYSQSP